KKYHGHEHVQPLSKLIAPNNPLLGVLLPYSLLHHLIMHDVQQPVIATSGNISEEPICIDNHEALHRLNGIADFFLIHNRPILRHADDSIIRIIAGREVVLRRARGLAPLPFRLDVTPARSMLAVGGQLKNAIAMNVGNAVFVSQHIGDLETEQAYAAFQSTIGDFQRIYEVTPSLVVADKHPEYLSSKYASELDIPILRIQHHAAHVYSCMAENHLRDNVFGVSWDGTGYGDDGVIWGGEFFVQAENRMRHFGTFRSFPLPGGEAAIKEPRRAALGMLFEVSQGSPEKFGELPLFEQFSTTEYAALLQAMRQNINSPRTSSVGRIFDAVASIIGLRHKTGYEGQAAMELEALTEHHDVTAAYPFTVRGHGRMTEVEEIDWEPMVLQIFSDVIERVPGTAIAQKFHNTLSKIIVAMATHANQTAVVLSGGCFQNARLTEVTVDRLRQHGFTPYWHQRIPPNDGGLALGQLYGAILLEQQKEPASAKHKRVSV
ncbi:MAG: Sua5/YciO/YrdC/YwlC family protein, partial [Bacteroidota bacterium]